MARLNTRSDIKNNKQDKLKKTISNVVNFIIYDKSVDYAVDSNDNVQNNENKNNIENSEFNFDSDVTFIKTQTADGFNDCSNSNDSNEDFVEIFDSVKQEKQELSENKNSQNKNYSFGYEDDNNENTKTTMSAVSDDYENQYDESHETDETDYVNENIDEFEKIKEEKPVKSKYINKRLNVLNVFKKLLILIFSVICGSVALPFGMNPLGISLICAADKYIFYIYSGLIVSLLFQKENTVVFFILYTIVAGVKFYLKYNKEKSKVEMLSESVSFNNLSKKEKVKLINLIHFNDTGSSVMSILVCAISCCIIGFIKIALKPESIVYTDIAFVMLFMFTSMLFTYLYSGLFEIGEDNKTLERAGICSVIFTVIYFLAPFYLYTMSIGYIISFALTFIAANSGVHKLNEERLKENKKNKNKLTVPENEDENNENATDNENNEDEEIISRFAVKLISHDGVLSDMTRGALVGLLCGVALGDTAGAVTLGISGLVSGLFFSQSPVLAVISGFISAVSYSVYVAGIDAIQIYIPNMLAGLTLYLPASRFYNSILRKIEAGKYNKKASPILDRGLLVTELPANKLNNLSDAFHGLSGIFYEISEKLKNPNSNEIKTIVSACVEKTCERCGNYDSCSLLEKSNLYNMQKKCVEFLIKNGRLNQNGITKTFLDDCVKISDIQNKINAVYRNKTEENIENNKTKIFADNYENIAKLLQNNIKSGKEDIAFKRDMSEKIFICLESMGIECENVIVMGERKKTVYIFGIKMVNYSGTIADITIMLEQVCGTCFDFPEYILRDDYVIMKNQSRNKFRIYSVQMSKAAGENYYNKNPGSAAVNPNDIYTAESGAEFAEDNPDANIFEENIKDETDISTNSDNKINGDSISIFNGKDGYLYGLISDGMGSGKSAALSSRLTVLLTEKLLSAGNQKDLTVEMINSLLISKSDECFASVDLFEGDLITGKATFIKAGAAPSFVVRNGKLFKIQSSTVPAGIIESINSEQTKFDMEDGDYILMLSDGIISTFEEGAWLLEMLGSENNLKDPKVLLSSILREAARKNHRKDDMSVLLMKIAEERKTLNT